MQSKYNDRYKNNTSIRMPDYLLKREEGGSQKMIAKWKCGNVSTQGRKKRILEHRGGEKRPYIRSGRRVEHTRAQRLIPGLG